MRPKKVAILTAGGLAPCLSASIAGLIERYTKVAGDIEIICYRSGYKGLLLGDSITAADSALRRESGVIGEDEERGDVLRALEFQRIKGGKPFDVQVAWFREMLAPIGQKLTPGFVPVSH